MPKTNKQKKTHNTHCEIDMALNCIRGKSSMLVSAKEKRFDFCAHFNSRVAERQLYGLAASEIKNFFYVLTKKEIIIRFHHMAVTDNKN